MSVTLAQAYSVLFPVIDPLQMTDQVRSFLGAVVAACCLAKPPMNIEPDR